MQFNALSTFFDNIQLYKTYERLFFVKIYQLHNLMRIKPHYVKYVFSSLRNNNISQLYQLNNVAYKENNQTITEIPFEYFFIFAFKI